MSAACLLEVAMPSGTGQLRSLGVSFVLYFSSQHVEGTL